VASAAFGTTRRGYDPAEVRDFLQQVAAELSRLHEREQQLERELHAARRAPAPSIEDLDDSAITSLLGEETARVLSTAREAAAQIRSRSEEGSARLFREAQDDAARLREQAELEAARRRQEAVRDAEAELEAARQQGRNMVAEAREYRERVLADLAKRRELARQQLAELQGGRERLLQAFERARVAAVDVQVELTQLGDEPDELVNLAPTTGPVPITVPRQQVPLVNPQPVPSEPDPEETAVDALDESVAEVVPPTESTITEDEPGAAATPETAVEAGEESALDAGDDDPQPLAPVVALFAGELSDEAGPTGGIDKPSVDDLFAKLRAAKIDAIANDSVEPAEAASPPPTRRKSRATSATTEVVAADTGTDPTEPEGEGDSPFVVRDEALSPVEVNLARKFKRALADEQNDLLDALRRREPVRSIDEVLPTAGDHLAPYLEAAREELPGAARAGARSASEDDPARLDRRLNDAGVVDRVLEQVGPEIVEPLRDRLERAIAEADGDNGVIAAAVRSMYREWKTQRFDELAAELTRGAYARGAYAAMVPGTPVRWVGEPGFHGCADAELNAAAGAVRVGDSFPSGDLCPPAALGCRCLLVTDHSAT
jgi:DivIVA domain-containing protein